MDKEAGRICLAVKGICFDVTRMMGLACELLSLPSKEQSIRSYERNLISPLTVNENLSERNGDKREDR